MGFREGRMESHTDETLLTGKCSFLPWGEQLAGFNLGENSLVAGLGNEHLLGRPSEHYLCQCLCKNPLFPLWCGVWKKSVIPLERKGLITVSPYLPVLYNSFLCHCLTSIIIMLPDSFLPPFLLHGGLLLKAGMLMFQLWVYICVCACICSEYGHSHL